MERDVCIAKRGWAGAATERPPRGLEFRCGPAPITIPGRNKQDINMRGTSLSLLLRDAKRSAMPPGRTYGPRLTPAGAGMRLKPPA